VVDEEEGEARKAQHLGDVLRRDFEGPGAQNQRPLTQLFECDSVVQTAR
jgi:hypothetical protein